MQETKHLDTLATNTPPHPTSPHCIPTRRNSAIVADQLMARLPANSPLWKVKKEILCAAYLPDGVCNHGNRTNGMVEVFNGMCLAMRHQETPFRSLQVLLDPCPSPTPLIPYHLIPHHTIAY